MRRHRLLGLLQPEVDHRAEFGLLLRVAVDARYPEPGNLLLPLHRGGDALSAEAVPQVPRPEGALQAVQGPAICRRAVALLPLRWLVECRRLPQLSRRAAFPDLLDAAEAVAGKIGAGPGPSVEPEWLQLNLVGVAVMAGISTSTMSASPAADPVEAEMSAGVVLVL